MGSTERKQSRSSLRPLPTPPGSRVLDWREAAPPSRSGRGARAREEPPFSGRRH